MNAYLNSQMGSGNRETQDPRETGGISQPEE